MENRERLHTIVLWPPHVKSWLIGKDWCWEGLGAGGEGDDRGWNGWMASPTRWTWVWVNSWSWWWTGRPGVLRFMGSQRDGHNWATELNTLLIGCKLGWPLWKTVWRFFEKLKIELPYGPVVLLLGTRGKKYNQCLEITLPHSLQN